MKRIIAIALCTVMTLISCQQAVYANDIVIKEGTEILIKVIDKLKSGVSKEGSVIRFIVDKAVRDKEGPILPCAIAIQ